MLAFRVNASAKTGLGHLNRSIYLANLIKRKTPVIFYINSDKKTQRYLAQWKLPAIFSEDFKAFDKACTAIIFDLKSFNDKDLHILHQAKLEKLQTLQITSLGLGQQKVNYIIDSAIENKIPYSKGPSLLSGPEYALLHHKFIHFNQVNRKYNNSIKNLFISLGEGFEYRSLRIIIDLLHRFGFNLKIAPGYYLKKSGQKTLKRIYSNVCFVGKTDNLARSFFKSDLAIISPGIAAFEAAATGTPALYGSYEKDHDFVANSFEKQGMGKYIGPVTELTNKNIIKIIKSLDLQSRIKMGLAGKKTVDGRGVYRVINHFIKENVI